MFERGTIYEVDKNDFIAKYVPKQCVVLFDRETTLAYLRSKSHKPMNEYVLICKIEDYEEYSKYESIESVEGIHRKCINLINVTALIPTANVVASNALERLD